jgi:hypothetical protein
MGTLSNTIREEKQTIEWLQHKLLAKGDDFSGAASWLAMATRSFQRHMDCMMAIKERGGYMDNVLKRRPDLSHSVEVLRQENDEFRGELGFVLGQLENHVPNGETCLAIISHNMTQMFKTLDDHNEDECDLFHEAFDRDEGGEG